MRKWIVAPLVVAAATLCGCEGRTSPSAERNPEAERAQTAAVPECWKKEGPATIAACESEKARKGLAPKIDGPLKPWTGPAPVPLAPKPPR